jgi:hypothetical protein
VETEWQICSGESEAGIFTFASSFTLALLLMAETSSEFPSMAGSCENDVESSCSTKGVRYLQVINHHKLRRILL